MIPAPVRPLLAAFPVLLAPWWSQAEEAPKAAPAAAEKPAPQGEAYAIKFVRPMAAGYRFREKTTAKHEIRNLRETDGESTTVKTTRYSIRFDCSQDVLEVTPKGSPMAYRLEFHELVKIDENGKETALLPPGSVVMARARDGEREFRLNGKLLDEKIQVDLVDLFGMSEDDDGANTDDVYGSEAKRHLGERWSINSEKAKDWFKNPNGLMDTLLISGECVPVQVHKVGGVDCLQVGQTLSARQIDRLVLGAGGAGLGLGQSFERQTVRALKIDLPLDPTLQERGYTNYRYERTVVHQVDDDADDTRDVVILESNYRTDLEPLPPKSPPEKPEKAEKPEKPADPAKPGKSRTSPGSEQSE